MADINKTIKDLDEQIAWIQDNDFHKFPGWGHAVLAMKDALELLKSQQAEVEKWEDEKKRAIRDIDLYIADAESDAKTPQRTGKGYSVGLGYGLLIAKEILQGIRKHG